MSTDNVRLIATRIITQLLEERGSLTSLLQPWRNHSEYPLLQEICYGTCRWFFTLEAVLRQLLQRPLKNKDQDIKCLLVVGLYQLKELAVPDYAAINETVLCAKQLGKPWATGLVNAVLRNYVRNKTELEAFVDAREGSGSFPVWLAEQIDQQWGVDAKSIYQHSNLRPPMTLRVNLGKCSRNDYLAKLSAAGLEAQAGQLSPSAIYLRAPCETRNLPGFQEGLVSVQDEASQLVPQLLELGQGLSVLDACAAPGGKTCHILESEHSLTRCMALDSDSARLEKISENFARLQLAAQLQVADASNVDSWWDGEQFDRILLDAPCSATGVIRRHPDIKLLLSSESVTKSCQQQQQLLASLWPCLKPGGRLLYSTCSILQQENSTQIAEFLSRTADAKYERIAADWGVECEYGKQLLPGTYSEPDGFYFCVLRKD